MNQDIERTEELLSETTNKSKKKKLIIVAVLAGVLAIAAGVYAGININGEKQIDEYLKIAQAELREGDYKQAVKSFGKAIEIDGNNSEAYEGRADAYVGLKQPGKAIPDYHKAIENDKKSNDLYEKGVQTSIQANNENEANAFLDEMAENLGEDKASNLRRKEFNPTAKKVLDQTLEEERTKIVREMDDTKALEQSTYFDLDNDGIDELITISRLNAGSGRVVRAFAYRNGEAEKILEEGEYGLSIIETYDDTHAISMYWSGHGSEGYMYYKYENGHYSLVASRGHQAIAGGGMEDGPWGYSKPEPGSGSAEISKTEFDSITKDLLKGKTRRTTSEEWINEFI